MKIGRLGAGRGVGQAARNPKVMGSGGAGGRLHLIACGCGEA